MTIELIALIALLLFALYTIYNRINEQRIERERAEAEIEQDIEEEIVQEERSAMLEEWNLLLVNNEHAIPDDYEVATAEVEGGVRSR